MANCPELIRFAWSFLLLCTAVGMPQLIEGRHRGDFIPSPDLFSLGEPPVFMKKRIYTREPDYRFAVNQSYDCIPPRDPETIHFCPEVIEVTVDFKRKPVWLVQKICSPLCKEERGSRCFMKNESKTVNSTGICKDLKRKIVVRIRGKGKMYQTVSDGCYCDLNKRRG